MNEENEVIEIESKDIETVEEIQQSKPTLEQGNYILEVLSEGQVIKKLAIANSEISITKLADGGMTIDLK